MDKIDSFQGPHRFLSNFWPATVWWEGLQYPTVEHAYQAAKTWGPGHREKIRDAKTPGDAKRLGRHVPVTPDWPIRKESVMAQLVSQKFTQHATLRQMLLDTGDAELVEGNTWGDTFWGVCRGKGDNRLGRILMKVRDYLRLMEGNPPQ